MNNTRLINLLKSFSEEELREFELLVNSPFYNRENALTGLFGILKKHYPEFNDKDFSKENIFHKLFPGKKFNDPLLRNTFSDLLKKCEEYLKISQFRQDKFYSQYLLLKQLTNRKQNSLFVSNVRKIKSVLEKPGIMDELYYQNTFLLEDELRRNVVVNSSKVLFDDDNLGKQAYNLRIYHLTENIKLYAILLNQKLFIYDHDFDFEFLETVREYIGKNYKKYSSIPYIAVFYNCVMLYKTKERLYFDRLKAGLKKYFRYLSLTDRKNMYMVLTNHCNSEVSNGRYEFNKVCFEIYKDMIKTKAYLEGNNFMAHYIFNSIAQNAIASGELKWAEKFINEFRSHVHSDFRESSYGLCNSILQIKKGNYDKALESLSIVKPMDIIFKLKINHTLLIIYFLQNETESFLSLTDSFNHFLRRNKELKNSDKIVYSNFTTYIRKLFKFRNMAKSSDKNELFLLKCQIESDNKTVSKQWMMEILNDMTLPTLT